MFQGKKKKKAQELEEKQLTVAKKYLLGKGNLPEKKYGSVGSAPKLLIVCSYIIHDIMKLFSLK